MTTGISPARASDVLVRNAVGAGHARRLLAGLRAHRVEIVVLVVAVAARLGVILRHDGVRGIIGYDCGVYFAGADALIHGRLPYRDFILVHPPGITLILTPFASLTHWLTDWHAFILTTLAFCLLGGVNAVLVIAVCRRLGLTALAAGLGGLFYAAWFGSVSAEFEVKLEPLGNLFLLCGLLLLLRAQRMNTRWASLVAGVLLGVTLTIKIWWGVPVIVLLVWHGWRRRSVRAGAQAALGAAISVAVVYTPFFVADPSGMFTSVVTDQLGRSRSTSATRRISALTTLPKLLRHMSPLTGLETAVPFVLAAAAVLVLAWRASVMARVMVAMVVIQFVVLIAAPSWFLYYSDYLAVSLAICVAAAATSLAGTRRRRLAPASPWLLTATMLVITTLVTISGTTAVRPYAGAAKLTRDIRNVKCVMTTNPTVLLRLDALTRGLDAGCRNWIDVTGRFYRLDSASVPRSSNSTWQRDITDYLRSGNAIIVWQPSSRSIDGHTAAAIERDGVLARAGGHTVYRVLHRP